MLRMRVGVKQSFIIAPIMAMLAVSGTALAQRPLRPDDIALANRIGFGINQTQAEEMVSLGTEAWLQGQLHPDADPGLPPDIAAMIDALPRLHKTPNDQLTEVATLRKNAEAAQKAYAMTQVPNAQTKTNGADAASPTQMMSMTAMTTTPAPPNTAPMSVNQVVNTYRGESLSETQVRRVLREVYGRNQLHEQMSWFWFNHFNVQWDKGDGAYRPWLCSARAGYQAHPRSARPPRPRWGFHLQSGAA